MLLFAIGMVWVSAPVEHGLGAELFEPRRVLTEHLFAQRIEPGGLDLEAHGGSSPTLVAKLN